jgi:hypothetical protein
MDDGWPRVWAEMSDEELRERLRHYLFLVANGPLQDAKRIAPTRGRNRQAWEGGDGG